MKFLVKISLLTVTLFLLAACGGDSAPPAPEATTPATQATTAPANNTEANTASGTGFSATVTEAVETELNGGGYFMCDDDSAEVNIGANGGLSNNILITLPRDAAAGTYEIGTGNTSATYVGASVMEALYDRNSQGSVTLNAVPSAAGEQTTGTFEFTVESAREDTTITITGSFDFAAGNIAFANCGG